MKEDCADGGHTLRSLRRLRAEQAEERLQLAGQRLQQLQVDVSAVTRMQQVLEEAKEGLEQQQLQVRTYLEPLKRMQQQLQVAVKSGEGVKEALQKADTQLQEVSAVVRGSRLLAKVKECTVTLAGDSWRTTVQLGEDRRPLQLYLVSQLHQDVQANEVRPD